MPRHSSALGLEMKVSRPWRSLPHSEHTLGAFLLLFAGDLFHLTACSQLLAHARGKRRRWAPSLTNDDCHSGAVCRAQSVTVTRSSFRSDQMPPPQLCSIQMEPWSFRAHLVSTPPRPSSYLPLLSSQWSAQFLSLTAVQCSPF